MSNLRAYFFGNMYLSSIQQGIQALHAVHNMFVKYPHESTSAEINAHGLVQADYLWDWAKRHKTVILLNAGYAQEIANLMWFFNDDQNTYPWGVVREEEAALNQAYTSIGIVLPEKIFATAKFIREKVEFSGHDAVTEISSTGKLYIPAAGYYAGIQSAIWNFTKWELDMAERLNQYRLAR